MLRPTLPPRPWCRVSWHGWQPLAGAVARMAGSSMTSRSPSIHWSGPVGRCGLHRCCSPADGGSVACRTFSPRRPPFRYSGQHVLRTGRAVCWPPRGPRESEQPVWGTVRYGTLGDRGTRATATGGISISDTPGAAEIRLTTPAKEEPKGASSADWAAEAKSHVEVDPESRRAHGSAG